MFSFQAIQVLIFLIPGLIGSKIFDILLVRRQEQREFETIVEALIFSMLIYSIYSLVGIANPIALDQQNQLVTYSYATWSFMWLIIFSVVMPTLLAFIVNHDWHMKVARWLSITRKTSRASVWYDAFYDKTPLVIIDFVDGRRIFGWAEHFSDHPEKPYIYLSKPQWVQDGKYIDIGMDGMLITPEQKIAFVEFFKDEAQAKSTTKNYQSSRKK